MEQSLPGLDALMPQETVALPSRLFDFNTARVGLNQLIGSWSHAVSEAKLRRKERYIELDVEKLRDEGEIGEDETFIPDRVIDSNIKRDKSDTMAFLNAGYRLGIFNCISDPTIDARNLELEVTRGLTYLGYYREFDRTVDGAALHGMDYLEVVFDETKPLHVGFEHIGFDNLFFNRKVSDIQDSELVLRKYEITPFRLETFTQFGFDKIQIDNILDKYKEAKRNDTIIIYKEYFKFKADNEDKPCVYVAWFTEEAGTKDWLKAPVKLRMGVYEKDIQGQWVESDLDIYPIFVDIHIDDEQEAIVEHKGRGFLDASQQEANTAIITGFVNSVIKAASVYASPSQDDGESPEMKQLDIKLEPDGIYSRPLEFWSKPYPDVTTLSALQLLDTKNAAATGKIAAAVSNRKDSRKTAKELNIADQEQQKITTANLATFSEFLRGVLQFTWKIIQSQALQDKVALLLIENESTNPMGQIQKTYSNDYRVIGQVYDIEPAGNVDVVEAEQEAQKMMQDWPVFQNTPIAQLFLEKYIRIRYPKQADEYIKLIKAGDPRMVVASMATIIQGVMNEPDVASKLSPQDMQGLTQVLAEASKITGTMQQPTNEHQ